MPRVTDRFIGPGDVITVPSAPRALTPGDGVLSGNLFGMALGSALISTPVEMAVEGVWDIAKTAAQTFSIGDLVYWDNTAFSVTTVTAANRRIGTAVAAAAGGDATARVRLSGAPAPTGA